MRKPSPTMLVASAALFIALGGAGMAATGGTFILGQQNTAQDTTLLSSDTATGATLRLANSGGHPAARFDVNNNVAPFAVVNTMTKVQNLNSDLLDGLDSSAFTQGGGHVYSAHADRVPAGQEATLLTLPGGVSLIYVCSAADGGTVYAELQSGTVSFSWALQSDHPKQGFLIPESSVSWGQTKSFVFQALGSQPKTHTYEAMLLDVRFAGGWDPFLQKCSLEAVAETFA